MQYASGLGDTIAAIATPAGTGAIAVIRVSGEKAFSISDRVFNASSGKKISEALSHTVHFGTIHRDGLLIDEVIATIFRNPRSFTGDDTVEFSCHGSTFIQQQILSLLVNNGARLAEPGEFTMRAFLNKKMDLAQAEAVADVIAADSEAAHGIALRQMRGGFSNDIHSLREKLIHFASLLELELDFAEEDVEFAERTQLLDAIDETLQHTRKLSDSFMQGNVIRNGIPVAIAGKPNTGKSTLLNLLLNENRAIVSDIAGTTRDTIEEEIFLDGIKYRFIDTAGIRSTDDIIEQRGVERTMEKIRNATVILYLFDPVETSPVELQTILKEIRNTKSTEQFLLIPVANKSDKYNLQVMQKEFSTVPGIIFISAKNHEGINLLMENITTFASSINTGSGNTILTNLRHKISLDKTISALQQARKGLTTNLPTDLIAVEIRSALLHLGEITGEITTDDLLENIFSKFCIGK